MPFRKFRVPRCGSAERHVRHIRYGAISALLACVTMYLSMIL